MYTLRGGPLMIWGASGKSGKKTQRLLAREKTQSVGREKKSNSLPEAPPRSLMVRPFVKVGFHARLSWLTCITCYTHVQYAELTARVSSPPRSQGGSLQTLLARNKPKILGVMESCFLSGMNVHRWTLDHAPEKSRGASLALLYNFWVSTPWEQDTKVKVRVLVFLRLIPV